MKILTHKFVENIPESIEEGILYVSIPFETVIHKCACGCGNEVVTPLSPTDWRLIFNGETISLEPSIGSWSLKCKSHYFIRKNKIVWSIPYSDNDVERVREKDLEDKYKYLQGTVDNNKKKSKETKEKSIWEMLLHKLKKIFNFH